MIDLMLKAALLFTREYFIIALVTFGYFSSKREVYARALFILLFTMILNPSLKSIWQVPLSPHLGDGWAFPSGHMQGAFAFWGWLAYEKAFKGSRPFVAVLLGLIAWALIYFNYHDFIDVSAAWLFGGITLIFYNYFLKRLKLFKWPEPIAGCFLGILALPLIFLLPRFFMGVWVAEGALFGFSLGWYVTKNFPTAPLKKSLTITLAFLGIAFLYGIFSWMHLRTLFAIFCQFFLSGFWISFGAFQSMQRIYKASFLKKTH